MYLKSKRGAITIEAIISLTIFMFAFLSITSLSTLARAESKIQYALNQSAKEFSQYTYIFYRAELYDDSDITDKTKSVDELIQDTSDFTALIKSSGSGNSSNDSHSISGNVTQDFLSQIDSVKNNAKDIVEKGTQLYQKYKAAANDPTQVLQGIYAVIKHEGENAIKSKLIAPVVCKLLMPKYLENNEQSADEYLKSIGIENGLNGLNFTLSSLMEDGRTINFTVVYTVKYKIPLIGEREMTVKQTASTAAWKRDKDLDDVKVSIWNKPALERGKEIVSQSKNKNTSQIVDEKKKYGFDLYDINTNTVTNIISINTNSPTYISNDENNVMKLNEVTFKSKIKQNANTLNNRLNVDIIKMQNGNEYNVSDLKGIVYVYIPKGSQCLEDAQKYAEDVSKEFDQITIKVAYYDE